MPAERPGSGEVQTVHVNDPEVKIVFPGGIAVEVTPAAMITIAQGSCPALVRIDMDARPQVTLDIVEARGPEE